MIKALFTEKYRPKNLEDLILPERVMSKFKDGLTQNMLLAGSPGTGKTSTAKAIVNQFALPYLYINASTDTSVEVIRTRITDFCSTMSILDDQGKFKVVILDEVDGVSDQFFKALRATMEQFASNSRFIATCNYVNKIPDPILSRFEVINFDFDKSEETELVKKYIKRVYDICGKEEMTIEKPALVEFVKRNFPDLRSTLNKLQGYKTQGTQNITIDDVKKFNSVYKGVVKAKGAHLGITVDPDVDRLALVCQDGSMFGEEYTLVAVADYVLTHTPGPTVSNLSSTRALRDITEARNLRYEAAAVGEVNVVVKMKEIGAVIGGEGNGGIIYPELHYGRDSLVGIALFLSHLAHQNTSMTALRASYPNYVISKNKIDLAPTTNVDDILVQMAKKYAANEVDTTDGVKIYIDKEWVHLRKSNTEPIIRIYAESASEEKATGLALRIIEEIKAF